MINENVMIGGEHIYTRWGLVMESAEISPPEAETIEIEVPGRHGKLDITQNLFGMVPYRNRSIQMIFKMPDEDTWAETYSEIMTAVHGKQLQVVFDSDPGYYYYGRCYVRSHKRGGKIVEIEIECDADPYKYLISDPTQKTL